MKKIYKRTAAFMTACVLLWTMVLPVSAAPDYSSVFDAQYYYSAYADVQTVIGNDANKLLQHFIQSGMKEGRTGAPNFDVRVYMANNDDLVEAFGTKNLVKYYEHYMQLGKNEGRISADDGKVKKAIAFFTTKYRTGSNRAGNLELASSRINGIVLNQGDVFSFSDSILSRTEANGYQTAPSFADGEVVTSIGGGICQVSSTVYAALKSGNIPVLERYAHSLKVDYVPAGYDATISEGRKDLKFANSYDYPISIKSLVKNGYISILICR